MTFIPILTDATLRGPLKVTLATSFTLFSYLDFSSALKMEAKCSSETYVDFL
jgi:hypothetical protein